MKRAVCIAIMLLLSIRAAPAAVRQSLLDDKWTATDKTKTEAFSFIQSGKNRLLCFDSGAGFATIELPFPLKTGPMAVSWEVTISKGRLASWRNSGVVMAISTCSIDAMTENDFALVTAVLQQGVRCSVTRQGVYRPYQKRPGVWGFRDRRMANRFDLSMGGAGGHDYSIRWPGKDVSGTTLRFTIWRDSANVVRFAVFHGARPRNPWWTGKYTLPEDFAGKPLTTLSFRTTNEASTAKRLPPAKVAFKGKITLLEARGLEADEKFTPSGLNIDPPPHWILKKPDAAKHPSVFFTPKTLVALRKKFNHPMMVDYRKLVLDAAGKQAVEKVFQGSPPAWSSGLTALTWAYVLTEDKAYRPRLLRAIDRITTVCDDLNVRQSGWPGRMRQFLSIDEFNGHNLEAIATAYDCIYNELDDKRKTRILRMLNRGLDYYLGRLKARDWWYCSNPSNTIGVGNGLNGVVALVLRKYRPEDSTRAIEAAIETIRHKYIGVADDGGCIEGNMYWNYGMSYPIWFGYALKQTTGNDRGLLTSPKMRNAGNYLKLMLAGDGKFLCFNDTQPWLNGMLICAHSGGANDLPFLRTVSDHMAGSFSSGNAFGEQIRGQFSVSAFLGRDLKPAPKQFPPLPTLHTVRSIQEGILRSDGAVVPALVTGVKGKGEKSTHHANEDQGSVVVYARGENFLIDPGYFEGAATDHTLPLLGQYVRRKSWDARAEAKLSNMWETGDRRGMTVDSSRAYVPIRETENTPRAGSVRRVIVQVADEAVVWLDDISVPPAYRKATAQYQCGFPVRLDPGGVQCRIIGARSDMLITVDGPPTKLVSGGLRKFSKDWWVYARTGVKWHPVTCRYTTDSDRPMITICTPLAKNASKPKVHVTRGEKRVQVSIGREKPVVFKLVNDCWRSEKQQETND